MIDYVLGGCDIKRESHCARLHEVRETFVGVASACNHRLMTIRKNGYSIVIQLASDHLSWDCLAHR